MTINKTSDNGNLTIILEGRLDTTTAPQFQEALIPSFDEAKEIVLDFAGLEYISSAGLRVLMTGQKTSKAKGTALTVKNVSDEIMEIFEVTNFTDILTII
jgi:anti-anti-sigma factor